MRGFEGFGGASLQAAGAEAFAVQTLATQITVEHANGGQGTLILLPVRVENLQRDGGILGDLFQHPGGSGVIERAVFSLIGARFLHQGVKAALLIGIPPVFQRARGIVVAVFVRPGMERGLAQGLGQNASAALEVFDEVERAEADQGLSLMGSILILLWVIHMRRTLPEVPTRAYDNGVWDASAAGPAGGRAATTPG